MTPAGSRSHVFYQKDAHVANTIFILEIFRLLNTGKAGISRKA
jgi:hypothetical protein